MTIKYFKVDDLKHPKYPFGIEIVDVDDDGELLEIIDIQWFKTDGERAAQFEGADYANN
jgi:hypothetical protein